MKNLNTTFSPKFLTQMELIEARLICKNPKVQSFVYETDDDVFCLGDVLHDLTMKWADTKMMKKFWSCEMDLYQSNDLYYLVYKDEKYYFSLAFTSDQVRSLLKYSVEKS